MSYWRFTMMLVLILFLGLKVHAEQDDSITSGEDLMSLSLEELMDVAMVPAGSLTVSSMRKSPATITTLTQAQIQSSGARSLNELLDIYVPNLQMIRHHWENRHLGLRGIINDREDKYLLLVNGKIMNEQTHYGVLSERDLPMLTDIQRIEIVRGPGSAIYGAGAVAMVIDIVTDNANTFQGIEFTSRVGAIEEFYSGELKFGHQFKEDQGLFLYFGMDKYLGADQDDAPLVYGVDFTDFWGDSIKGGEPYTQNSINRDGQAWRDLPRIKTHAQYNHGPWDLWLRYTRGGEQYAFAQDNMASSPHGWLAGWASGYTSFYDFQQAGSGYQQISAALKHTATLSDRWKLTSSFDYDLFDYERAQFSSQRDAHWTWSHREDKYRLKTIAQGTLTENQSMAAGAEWSHEQYGRRSPGFPHDNHVLAPYVQPPYNTQSPRWNTNTFSFFGEHQWRLHPRWTSFISARLDKNTYTNWLFSPRFSLVHTPTQQDTIKFMLSKSLRMTFAEEMRWQWEQTGQKSEPEDIKSIELRYERQQTENLLLALGGYYHDLEVIAWDQGGYADPNDAGTRQVGDMEQAGIEGEVQYQTDRWKVCLSHGYTKLLSFDKRPGANTSITSKPYGYGDDLANWSNHITKLYSQYNLSEHWHVNGSLRLYWGFPGARDAANYYTDNSNPISRVPGYEDPYGPSIFLNLGLQYHPNENLTLRIDGHNLLGLIDDKYNKRLYGFNSFATYRSHAPAISISLHARTK